MILFRNEKGKLKNPNDADVGIIKVTSFMIYDINNFLRNI